MEKKQTAVEWLIEQLENDRATFFKLNEKEERIITLAGKDVVQQAKAMEKEQILDAANKLLYHNTGPGDTAAEQYYNETYGGQKE
jgi:hypothetical protein